MIGIIDAELVCNQCGQKINMKHLKCQKEKREKLISDFVKEYNWFITWCQNQLEGKLLRPEDTKLLKNIIRLLAEKKEKWEEKLK